MKILLFVLSMALSVNAYADVEKFDPSKKFNNRFEGLTAERLHARKVVFDIVIECHMDSFCYIPKLKELTQKNNTIGQQYNGEVSYFARFIISLRGNRDKWEYIDKDPQYCAIPERILVLNKLTNCWKHVSELVENMALNKESGRHLDLPWSIKGQKEYVTCMFSEFDDVDYTKNIFAADILARFYMYQGYNNLFEEVFQLAGDWDEGLTAEEVHRIMNCREAPLDE